MQYRKLSELKKLQNNPRIIKSGDFEKLKKSINDNPDYFEARPIILSDRTGDLVIIGGNQRYEAAKALGLEKLPTHLLKGLSEGREREITIRDNVNNGAFDWDVLGNEWDSNLLDAWGIDLPVGFGGGGVEEDEPPEVDEGGDYSSVLGTVYLLGNHRLLVGDSTDFGLVSELMNGIAADMVFTDPPYGVDYTGKTKDELKIENDKNTDTWAEVLPNFIANTKAGAAYYVCCPPGNKFKDFFLPFEQHCHLSATIIWVKNSFVLGHGDYHYKHEPILYGWNKEGTHKFYGDRSQTTIWDIDRPTKSEEHPTMKPLALLAIAINNSSKEGDIILDLFGGSGSTLIAAEQLGRTCYMAEIDPKYADVIRKRYAKFVNNNELPENWAELTKAAA